MRNQSINLPILIGNVENQIITKLEIVFALNCEEVHDIVILSNYASLPFLTVELPEKEGWQLTPSK